MNCQVLVQSKIYRQSKIGKCIRKKDAKETKRYSNYNIAYKRQQYLSREKSCTLKARRIPMNVAFIVFFVLFDSWLVFFGRTRYRFTPTTELHFYHGRVALMLSLFFSNFCHVCLIYCNLKYLFCCYLSSSFCVYFLLILFE